jgi:hypothetical protein
MNERNAVLRREHEWIEWAQPHGMGEVFERHFMFTEESSHRAAIGPSRGQVRIEQERSINEGSAVLKLTDNGIFNAAVEEGSSAGLLTGWAGTINPGGNTRLSMGRR